MNGEHSVVCNTFMDGSGHVFDDKSAGRAGIFPQRIVFFGKKPLIVGHQGFEFWRRDSNAYAVVFESEGTVEIRGVGESM